MYSHKMYYLKMDNTTGETNSPCCFFYLIIYLSIFFISGIVFVLPFLIRNSSELSVTWLIKYGTMIELMRVVNVFNWPRYVEVGEGLLELPLTVFYLHTLVLAVGCLIGTLYTIKKKETG